MFTISVYVNPTTTISDGLTTFSSLFGFELRSVHGVVSSQSVYAVSSIWCGLESRHISGLCFLTLFSNVYSGEHFHLFRDTVVSKNTSHMS